MRVLSIRHGTVSGDAHGERIYFLKAPGGLPDTIQSARGVA